MWARVLMCAWCFSIVLQGKPPVHAQGPTEHDLGQDRDIAAINRHLEFTDGQVNLLARQVDQITGGIEVFCWITGIITAGSIVVQVRSKRS